MNLLEQIAVDCADMREKQKMYFKEHTQSALIAAKEAERRVDALLAEWQARVKPEAGQMGLFGE